VQSSDFGKVGITYPKYDWIRKTTRMQERDGRRPAVNMKNPIVFGEYINIQSIGKERSELGFHDRQSWPPTMTLRTMWIGIPVAKRAYASKCQKSRRGGITRTKARLKNDRHWTHHSRPFNRGHLKPVPSSGRNPEKPVTAVTVHWLDGSPPTLNKSAGSHRDVLPTTNPVLSRCRRSSHGCSTKNRSGMMLLVGNRCESCQSPEIGCAAFGKEFKSYHSEGEHSSRAKPKDVRSKETFSSSLETLPQTPVHIFVCFDLSPKTQFWQLMPHFIDPHDYQKRPPYQWMHCPSTCLDPL
jgi:hypothetical protein